MNKDSSFSRFSPQDMRDLVLGIQRKSRVSSEIDISHLEDDLSLWRTYDYQKGDKRIVTDSVASILESLQFDEFGTITNIQSPNYAPREFPEGMTPGINFVVIHHTAADLQSSITTLTGGTPPHRVSVDFIVSESGLAYHLVVSDMPNGSDLGSATWHAGYGQWLLDGLLYTKFNNWSVGMEIVNADPDNKPFTLAQTQTAALLTVALRKKLSIPGNCILSHGLVDYNRKHDPSYLFCWEVFAKHGAIHMPHVMPTKEPILLYRLSSDEPLDYDGVKGLRIQLRQFGIDVPLESPDYKRSAAYDHDLAMACWQFKAKFEGRINPLNCNLNDNNPDETFSYNLNWYRSSQEILNRLLAAKRVEDF